MTKVLWVDHPEGDYLASFVFMGLCEELGDDNVVDYPSKLSFHGLMHRYPSPYAVPVGDGGGMPWERAARAAPDAIGTTGPYEWMRPSSGRVWSRDEVISRIGEFSLVVLAAPRTYNVPALEDIIVAVGRDRMPPIVIMDGEDYSAIRVDLVQKFQPKVYFKRELMPGSGCGCRLEPFSFATPVRLPVEPVEKDIDVLFLGGASWGSRDEACNALRAAFGERFVGGVRGHVAHVEYLRMLARAKIAISVRGYGYDTVKFFEIPSMPGTLLVSDTAPIVRPAPFVHGETALFFSSPSELVEVVRHALDDEPWRQKISEAGNRHLATHHTPRARAKELLRISMEQASI